MSATGPPASFLRLASVAAAAIFAARAAALTIPVIPAPAQVDVRPGTFRLSAETVIRTGDDDAGRFAAGYLADLVRRLRGFAPAVEKGASRGGDVVFRLAPQGSGSPEAYTLSIAPEGVVVSAGDARGLFYGAVTLAQLVAADAASTRAALLPAVRIGDAPRFAWRGLMLDSARHFQSPAFIERFIDWMALHKLNVLHWHLTDDQGWRLEIRSHPRLTAVGAWRVPAGAAAKDVDPATGRPRTYGGYYDQDTVRRIVRYAAARDVTIVPEIEMPGHASAALAAYPELAVDGQAPARVPADWGIYPNLFNAEESTFRFIEDVLGEVAELFPGQYVHVGGDEAVKDQWAASPRVRQRERELGVAGDGALQAYFMRRAARFLASKGKRLAGWDEIVEDGLPENATVMSWRGVDGARAASEAGHDAVLSPWPTLYFDNRQGTGADEPPGRGKVISLEDVYRFDPLPAGSPPALARHLLGVQANLWTEHIRTESRAEWMAMPRAAAVAEIGWSKRDRLDFPDFRRRAGDALAWYRVLGYRPADSAFRPPAPPREHVRRSQELRTCGDKLVLNLEDDAPATGERAVFLVDILEPCWLFEGADLDGIGSIAATVGQFPFNFQIGKERDAIHLRPPTGPDGELEIRIDGCDGARIASLPLGPAVGNDALTRLPAVAVAPRAGRHDLCLTFTGRGIDPMWAVDSVELLP